ncbi:hybrid sensor histidine kinase/response regulator [Methylogaea oryzae]|uniref:hybrid sensor histidine kinase/response regulator n=1 Tax=Methylogaea oryzae TaxID=1295382 RepID=UPI001C8255CF|nr:hybrid sensor histidine kinase/response regulator [Methylogaea oryzae]
MKTKKRRSLYRTLTVWLIVLMSLVSMAGNTVNYLYLLDRSEDYYSRKSADYVDYLLKAFEWPLWNVDNALIHKIAEAFAANAEIDLLEIRDDQGEIVYKLDKGADENRRVQHLSVQHDGKEIGAIELGVATNANVRENQRLLWLSLGNMVLVAMTLILSTYGLLARLLRKPIATLVEASEEIIQGNYRQIELPSSFTEFSSIISAFEAMADAVEVREHGLRRINENLFTEVAERKRAEAALRESEERWHFALEGAGDGVWDWDIQSGRTFFSKRWKEMLGYAEEAFDNSHAAFERHIHPEDTSRVSGALQDYFSGKSDGYRVEFRMRCKDGAWKWVLSRGKVIDRDAAGKPLRMIGTQTDITDRMRVDEELSAYRDHLEEEVRQRTAELAAAKEAAEAANRAKSTFLSNMSHELRTPLNAILGFAQLMGRDSRIPAEGLRNLDIINRSGRHLLALINDVLDISRIEAGRVTVSNAPFDLDDTLSAIEDMIRIRAETKGLDFGVERSGLLPRFVKGDANRLRQVLINLLGNAVKYTDSGRVSLRLRPEGDRICFEVADTGPGIAPEHQQRIFQPFYQTDIGIAKGEGTGLGLTISNEFVRLMGGEIRVTSTVGQGSQFAFSIPLPETDAPAEEAVTVAQRRVVSLKPNQPPVRVLVVEDNADSRLLITHLLEDVGFVVKGAANGQEAIESFQAWQPHFIWMDMRMPVLDGYVATQRIRALPGGDKVKIVALTASAFQEDQSAILAAGCDDLLPKPLEEARLFQVMGDLLGLEFNCAEAAADNKSPGEPTSALDLRGIDPSLRVALARAAETLDVEGCMEAVARMRAAHPDTAAVLETLIQSFRFDRLLAELQRESGQTEA